MHQTSSAKRIEFNSSIYIEIVENTKMKNMIAFLHSKAIHQDI